MADAIDDPFDLERFVAAQETVIAQVQAELSAGRKTTHWIWFVFPQLRGLGRSATARHYGIASRDEVLAYWRHAVLGPRLADCTRRVLAVKGRSLHEIFGSPDDLKFHSCMTLFARVVPDEPLFGEALARFWGGREDAATVTLLTA